MKNWIQSILAIFVVVLLNIFLFAVGSFLILYPQIGIRTTQVIFIAILFGKSIGEFWNYFIGRDIKNTSRLLQGVGFLFLAVLVLLNQNLRFISFSLLLSGIFLFDAVLKFLVALQYKESGLVNWWHSLVMSLISLIIMVLFWKKDSYIIIVQLIGVFICWQAISTLIDRLFRGQSLQERKNHWKFQFLYIHQNTYDHSFLPAKLFDQIEQSVKDKNDRHQFLLKKSQKQNVPMEGYTTMKVTIHSWNGDIMTMKGHSDFSFDGLCYSYGNYDAQAHYFGGNLSDGVMVVAPEIPYINYCLEAEKKVLIRYTLRISQQQKQDLELFLADWKSKATKWLPPILTQPDATDDASLLYKASQPSFYKFKSGQFKYYFVLNTNCIRFVQYVLQHIGFHDAFSNGLLTPGDYLDFFEKKFENPTDYDIIERQVKVKVNESEN